MASLFDAALRLGQYWKLALIFSICLLTLRLLLNDDATTIGRPPAAKPVQRPNDISPIYDLEDVPLSESSLGQKPDSPNGARPYDAVPGNEHVAICLPAWNSSADLNEFFVHHYHHMGIKRFYIMDDSSIPPLSSFEYPGVPRAALTFNYIPLASRNSRNQQIDSYTKCIEKYRDMHAWIAFLEADEFLETPGSETLSEILKTFEANSTVGALGVNWKIHTSNGLLTRPESTRKAFTECVWDDLENEGKKSDNRHIKSIVKTAYAGPPKNIYRFKTTLDTITVGETGDLIDSTAWRQPITRGRIALHRYALKSREEYTERVRLGQGKVDPKDESLWKAVEGAKHVPCPEMARYEP